MIAVENSSYEMYILFFNLALYLPNIVKNNYRRYYNSKKFKSKTVNHGKIFI